MVSFLHFVFFGRCAYSNRCNVLYYFIAFRSLRLKNHRKNTNLHNIFLSLLTNFFFIPYPLSLHHTNTQFLSP